MIETLQSETGNETLRTMHAQAEEFLDEEKRLEASSSRLSLKSKPQSAPDLPSSDSNSSGVVPSQDGENTFEETSNSSTSSTLVSPPNSRNISRLRDSSIHLTEGERSIIEQFESGVYVTLVVLPNGYKVFKRIRFRYKNYCLFNQFPHIFCVIMFIIVYVDRFLAVS